jgi:hypothetical protein
LDLLLEKRRRTSGSREIKGVKRFEPDYPIRPRPRGRPASSSVSGCSSGSSSGFSSGSYTESVYSNLLAQLPQQPLELPSNKALLSLRDWCVTSQHLIDADFPQASINAYGQIEKDMPFDDTCKLCFKKGCACDKYTPVEQPLKYSLMPYRLMEAECLIKNLASSGAKPKVKCPQCEKHFALVMQSKKNGGALHGHMCK